MHIKTSFENASVLQMLVRKAVFPAILLGMLASAHARQQSHPASIQMSTIKGTCEVFLAGIEDATSKCKSTLLNTTINSFVDFIFVSGDRTLTFSGNDHQIKPDEDTAVQPVNRIIYFDGIDKVERRAVGSCTYHNPYAGASKVVCTATMEGGNKYEAVFNTDGNVPKTVSPK